MAFAFGAGLLVRGTSPLAFNLKVSGSDSVLYAAITPTHRGSPDPSACSGTFDGAAMPVKFTDVTTSGSRQVRVFRLVAPNTGSLSGSLSWSGGGSMRVVAFYLTGVGQVTPDDAQDTSDGTGGTSSTSHTISSATGNMVVDVAVTNATVPARRSVTTST